MMNMVMSLWFVFDRYPCVYGFVFLGLRCRYPCKFCILYVQLALDLSQVCVMFRFPKKERSTSLEKEKEEKRRRRERERKKKKKKRLLVEWVWLDRDNSREWVPPDWFFYNFALVTHIPYFENQAKHSLSCGSHEIWMMDDGNWVISLSFHVIQTSSKSFSPRKQIDY